MIAFFLSRGAWLAGGTCGAKAHYDGIKAFSETDLTEDLKSIDVPTLIHAGGRRPDRSLQGAALLQLRPSSRREIRLRLGRHAPRTRSDQAIHRSVCATAALVRFARNDGQDGPTWAQCGLERK